METATAYFLYALDTEIETIVESLPVSNETLAKQAFLFAKRQIEKELEKEDWEWDSKKYHIGYAAVEKGAYIEYEKPNGWKTYGTFNRSDFDIAAEQTRDNLTDNRKDDHYGLRFIRYAVESLEKNGGNRQEYYLSYYETKYPPCRSVLDNDTDGIEFQRGKPCFLSKHTPDPDYEGQCKHRAECDWSKCFQCPYQCITCTCPELQKVLTYRCEIGKLTDEEKDVLLKRTGILQDKCFDLSPLAIDTLTLDERLDHKEALKRFWSHVTYHTPQNGDDYFTVNFIKSDNDFYWYTFDGYTPPHTNMVACLNTAYSIMAELHKTNPEPAVNRQMPIKPPIKPNEWADKPADVNVINKELTVDFGDKSRAILKEILHEVITESKDMAEKTTTTAVFNALKRVQDDDETALEKIHRLQQIPGMTWKMIAQEVSPDIAEENIESEGERLRKQHERAYSPAERKQRKKRKS